MIHNLLNTELLASCMQEAKRHKSIEDEWKLVYWFFDAVIHITSPIIREEYSFQEKPRYIFLSYVVYNQYRQISRTKNKRVS